MDRSSLSPDRNLHPSDPVRYADRLAQINARHGTMISHPFNGDDVAVSMDRHPPLELPFYARINGMSVPAYATVSVGTSGQVMQGRALENSLERMSHHFVIVDNPDSTGLYLVSLS